MNKPSRGKSRALSQEQNVEQGKAARMRYPRERQGDWSTNSRTSDPLSLALLGAIASGTISVEVGI